MVFTNMSQKPNSQASSTNNSLLTRLDETLNGTTTKTQSRLTFRTKSDDDDDDDDDVGLTCPICHCIMVDSFITRCGHSYCHGCIARHLNNQKWCPVCRRTLLDTDTCPNFNLNKVIEQQMTKPKPIPRNTRNHANLKMLSDYLDTLPYTEDVLTVLTNARVKRKKVVLYEDTVQSSLLSAFLSMVEDHAAQKATKWKRYQDLAFHDKLSVQQAHAHQSKSITRISTGIIDENESDNDSQDDDDNNDDDEIYHDSNNHGDRDMNSNSDDEDRGDEHNNRLHYSVTTSGNSTNRKSRKRKYKDTMKQSTRTPLAASKELDLALTRRRNRMKPHFSGLMDFYFTERQKPYNDLTKLSSTLYQLTLYSHWIPVDTIHYSDLSMSSSIVSSIEFDRDEDHFAVGGVSKEIKFYDFNMLNDCLDERFSYDDDGGGGDDDQENPDSQDSSIILPHRGSSTIGELRSVPSFVHCPLSIIPCEHKISCLSWNPYINSRLASSDYEGVVNLWDTNTGQKIRAYNEHRQRAWSVDTCTSNPLMMASASDDACVKIWSIHEKNSLLTLTQQGNVCCAKFAPNNQHLLAVGSADHRITCYDLRNTNNPLQVFSGHDKAVSYVKWNGDDEMTSASTDNTLKLWKIGTNECIRTYTGHRNEKNFVGLSVKNENWISCGSENNTVFTYHKNSSHPVAQYKFTSIDPITGQQVQNEDTLFVSSVCWKRDSMKLLASNSKGVIKVLQLVE